MATRHFSLKFLMLAALFVACFTWLTIVSVNRTTRNMQATRSAYAAQLVAYMCVEHMKANNSRWPMNWDDLADDLDAGYAKSGQKWEWVFSDLKQRVGVNWSADPTILVSNPNSDQVVWILDFPDREHYMTSPNEIILKYLQSTNSGTDR